VWRFNEPLHATSPQLLTPRELDKQRGIRTESGKTPVIKKTKTVQLSRLRLVGASVFSENARLD